MIVASESTTACVDCSVRPQHPGSVVRLVGKDHSGNVISLCTRCWILRNNDANVPAAIGKLPTAKGKKKR